MKLVQSAGKPVLNLCQAQKNVKPVPGARKQVCCKLEDAARDFEPIIELNKHNTKSSKQRHMKVLLDSFHLDGHTLGFHPKNQNDNHSN